MPACLTKWNSRAIWACIALAAVFGLLTMAASAIADDPPATAEKSPSEQYRFVHDGVRSHLTHMTQLIGEMGTATPDEQKQTMAHVTGCMGEHIVKHAAAEDAILYPLIDSLAGTPGPHSITATMRHEHVVIARWVKELKENATQSTPDVAAFQRRADNLLGLVATHMEAEEEILLPILDAKMSAASFKEDVMAKMGE